MDGLSFEQATREHARAIEQMRRMSAIDLTEKLGAGHWSGFTRIESIRERIACADTENLRKMTLYVASQSGEAVGSVAVTTFPPGFWRRSYWHEPKATALGVFNLVIPPSRQRQGIGTFLMNGVENLASAHSIPFIRLDAYSENPISTSFYRAIGYEERGRINVRTVGLVLFEKRISTCMDSLLGQ